MDLKAKEDFDFFIQRALTSNMDDCYIELYNILLRAFVAADVDFDGKVSNDEFDGMIEAAAVLPRKFGYKWWDEDKCPDEAARKEVRSSLFKQIDENADGGISFDEWLSFALKHYRTFSSSLPKTLDNEEKDAFVACCKKHGENTSPEYRRLYWFHWKCFQAADADRDGKVSLDEFSKMIEMASSAPKRFGMSVGPADQAETESMFKAMDENGDGAISFDEWLTFSLENIISKVAAA